MKKSYADIDQCKKLAEILPLDSADMSYTLDFDSEKYYISTTSYKSWVVPKYAESYKGLNQVLPCWSLAALLNVLPILKRKGYQKAKPQLLYDATINKWVVDSHFYTTNAYDNLVDACYEMILELKERNLI